MAEQLIFITCYLKICKCAQTLARVDLVVIKWNHELRFIISFNLFFLLSLGSSRVFFFPKVPSLVYKLEMCKERMFSALTHSGVWSLFQAVLMKKYAMNLEHLQPWRWQIAFCFTSSVCMLIKLASWPSLHQVALAQQSSSRGALFQRKMKPFWDISL